MQRGSRHFGGRDPGGADQGGAKARKRLHIERSAALREGEDLSTHFFQSPATSAYPELEAVPRSFESSETP